MIAEKAGKTILVVDDEPENLRAYQEILTDMGHRAIMETGGGSALLCVDTMEKIDLVITDYMMPGMSGLEFVSALKRKVPSMLVIMITAHANIESYFQSLSEGVFEYVNKPVRKDEFERIVKMALARACPDNALSEGAGLTALPNKPC